MKSEITRAIELRKNGEGEKALELLLSLLSSSPEDPDLLYQIAWTCDSLGREAEAAPFYERAIAGGLKEDREGAILGLGSTYRCLGRYDDSLRIFDQGAREFPENRALRVFRALTLFNLGRAEESVSALLVELLDTTSDRDIRAYERALRFYSDKLTETWN